MEICPDGWLAEVMGQAVFRVAIDAADTKGDAARRVLQHAAAERRALYFAGVDTWNVDEVRCLMPAGFYPVTVSVTLDRDPRTPLASRAPSVPVVAFDAQHRDAVLQIAASAFRYSRFHVDPCVPVETANLVKRAWVESYVAGRRGDRLFVAVRGTQPVGFLAALAHDTTEGAAATIDLMAASADAQRQGVGRSLVTAFVEHYRDRCARLQVGTQAANVPSLRLYESCGFSIARTAYAMHLHVRDGRPVGR
jgi:ribosomal protein S18 acetylase RimI-like enzyme